MERENQNEVINSNNSGQIAMVRNGGLATV
jgi:hypothetical protein